MSYNPQESEPKIYKQWEESGYFNPDVCVKKGVTKKTAEPFTIVLPPPNVTGRLHMGHAAMLAIEDILVRFNRMRGKKTLWIPGTDHAAIATQSKVEKIIYKEEGKSRYDLGREVFLKRVEQYAQESHDTIVHQVKSMGSSLDWSREAYTLDEPRYLAVYTAFKNMYDDGLIYRGHRIVNWDPKGQTTISDDEIVYQEQKTKLYTFKYSKDFPIAIATTRPETKVGDTAVAVHPDDTRYKKYIGQEYKLTFCGVPLTVKVVADKEIDKTFGTGAVGVTPAHSTIDWEIAERHNLSRPQIIDEKARMMVGDERILGKKVLEAREIIVAWLKEENLLIKEEEITHNIGTAERTGAVVEPLPKLQWFIAVNKKFKLKNSKIKGIKSGSETTLKEIMRATVKNGQTKILPKRFEKIYFHWIDNLRDWCISRQIWYGHQVPAWYCGGVEKSSQLRMGFHKDVVPQVFDGKTKTYRLRDYGFKVGDKVLFENSQTRTLFGYAIITKIEETRVDKIDYADATHYKTYKNLQELITAFKLRNPDKVVTAQSKAYLYAYEFHKFSKQDSSDGCGQIIAPLNKPKICPACGGTKLKQDSDTLDTWFSSGLWTFSTLGWPHFAETATRGEPGPKNDFANYHPTNVLETGYDILFFWIARMILMSGYNLGEIPFETVYLHGLVRDGQGRKMSKSLGNIVDPLDLIAKYGADATRLSLIIGAAPGNDVKLSEDKVRGYRNFTTKIWNAAHFVTMNYDPKFAKVKPKFTAADKKDLLELKKIKVQVTRDIESFKLHSAADTLYHYFWHTFADKIIESAKSRLKSENKADKKAAFEVLSTILLTSLTMLHPFIPFVTETIYQDLPFRKAKSRPMLLVEQW